MRIILAVVFLFFLPLELYAQATTVQEEEVEVILGIDKIISLDFTLKGVQIGNEQILGHQPVYRDGKYEITLKGLKPGKTSAILRDPTGAVKKNLIVTVVANDQSRIVQQLREFLGDVEGLEIGIKGESVYVGGRIVVPDDIGKVVIILEKYPEVIRLVELSPLTQRVIARKMQEEIQKNNLKNVTVRVINKTFWLEGVVTSDAERNLAVQIAGAYLPDNITSLARQTGSVQQGGQEAIRNFISVNAKSEPAPVPKMVKISAQFVELVKDYNKIFGFKWNPLLSGEGGSISFGKSVSGGVTTKSNGTLSGTISNLFPRLASAKNAGYARIIQSGVVITKEKETATLSKSTKKPFALGSGEFQTARDAEAGFNLKVTPVILQEEKIDLDIGLGVSATAGDPPETVSNNIATKLIVKSDESAVVGGIVIKQSSTDFDRNPPGGVAEVENGQELFSFIRSKSLQNSTSQFVVFVTPLVIQSASEGTEEIKRKFRQRGR